MLSSFLTSTSDKNLRIEILILPANHSLSLLLNPDKNFQKLIAALNPQQRQAVEQIEGPALVVAGPGTGKTQLLAARIGNILTQTDTSAQSILCLTFTDAAAQAMRRRLLQIIGAEAHRVAVHTFHGFCSRVIAENPDHFGWRDFEPASELERIEISRQLLEKLPERNPLRRDRKNPFTFEKHLLDLFSLMKKENWAPGDIRKKAKNYLADLPARPDFVYKKSGKNFQKGDLKTAAIADEQEKMERLAAAADLFPKFNRAMRDAGRYDFDDMILWVLDAFANHEILRLHYQEKYLYLLVDEFQDTNGSQNRLLDLLTNFWQSPNIFIVGDDDQSIYEFQGARLKNLRDFYLKYAADLALTVLSENYRSSQAILDTATRVIQKNQLRAVRLFDPPLEKRLLANVKSNDQPTVVEYPSPLAEAADVIAQIIDLQKLGADAGEIAVLYREHRQVEMLMQLLEKRGIPFETKRPENVLALPLVRQFRELLEYLRDELRRPFSGESRLFKILHFRFWKIAPLDVAKLAAGLTNSSPIPHPSSQKWRERLADFSFLKSQNLAQAETFVKISEKIEDWLAAEQDFPLPQFLEKILNQSGLLAWAMSLPDRVFHLQTLNTLLDFAKKEALRRPLDYSLARLLDQLDTLDANRFSLPMQRLIRTAAEGGRPTAEGARPSTLSRPPSAVQLLTAHGSKGMEFQNVFVIGCNEENWENKRSGNRHRFALPDNLTFSDTEDETEALRRLFFVACTRAKQRLQISFSEKNLDGKDLLASQFVRETELPILKKSPAADALAAAQATLLLDAPRPVVTLPEAARLDDLLADFALSPTSFNRFLRCPLSFYYQDVLRVPEFSSENAAFGQAMHAALQQYFLAMRRSPRRDFPSEKFLVETFEKEMERQRAFFGVENFRQFLALGQSSLPKYRAAKLGGWRADSEVERRVSQVELDGVPLTGVIDRFDKLDGGRLRVVDYKTGQFLKEKTESPSERLPHGGDYRRQMFFYKILLEGQQPSAGTVASGVISYLEPDSKTGAFRDIEIEFGAAELDFFKKLLVETDARIRRREFAEGCGEATCAWCRMHRENEFPEVFENMESDLDDAAG